MPVPRQEQVDRTCISPEQQALILRYIALSTEIQLEKSLSSTARYLIKAFSKEHLNARFQ